MRLPAGLQAVILDLDGTLVDTAGDFVVALNLMLHDLGLPAIDHGFVARTVGKGSEHLIRQTLAQSQDEAGVARLYDQACASLSESPTISVRAGCPVVLVTYGYNHGRPVHEVPADGYVDRLDQLQPAG
jgi:phosphoglycolate phosphatase-like HAD superfamily hydrolase